MNGFHILYCVLFHRNISVCALIDNERKHHNYKHVDNTYKVGH